MDTNNGSEAESNDSVPKCRDVLGGEKGDFSFSTLSLYQKQKSSAHQHNSSFFMRMSLIYTAPSAAAGAASSSVGGHGLYIGGKKEAKSRSTLERWGITHVLNVTPEKDSSIQAGVPNYFENKSGGGSKIVYRRIPVYDTATSDLISSADSIVGFISSGLHHGSVLVHCKEGVSRSTTCVLFFLMRKLGMTYEDAFAMCKRKRPEVQPIPAFVEQCQKYERKCRKLGVVKSSDCSSSSSSPKKRKVGPTCSIGPIGPAIGPAIGPSIGPEPSIAHSSGPSIGPAIGPTSSSTVGPSKGGEAGEAPVIGPAVCPSSNTATSDDTNTSVGPKINEDSEHEREPKKAKVIGPAPHPGGQ